MIYAADEPATAAQLSTALGLEKPVVRAAEEGIVLAQFFEACPSRHAMIVAFLAVLEMVRLQAVVLVQKTLFAEILLRKHKMFDVVFTEDGNVSDSSQIDEQYS